MVYENRGRITYRLRDIITNIAQIENRHFRLM